MDSFPPNSVRNRGFQIRYRTIQSRLEPPTSGLPDKQTQSVAQNSPFATYRDPSHSCLQSSKRCRPELTDFGSSLIGCWWRNSALPESDTLDRRSEARLARNWLVGRD